MPAAPRPASTVVLLRPAGRRFEVLLVRRHARIAFMGGAHVFPGGRVDDADRIDDPLSICDGVAQASTRMPELGAADAVAHHVAAVRELLEEAGVLLASPLDPARLQMLRCELDGGGQTLPALARREGMRLSLDRLVPFARWITPAIETKRFDAWFFVAVLPEGQNAVHDDHETIESEWMEPDRAIDRCRAGEIALPPPTWTTLRMLSTMAGVEEVMVWARQRRIAPLQPGVVTGDNGPMLTVPGDPETRFILVEGQWRPVP
jgi:8-oxo-dGTP pyrophosphatase MutT (NUDIX family)